MRSASSAVNVAGGPGPRDCLRVSHQPEPRLGGKRPGDQQAPSAPIREKGPLNADKPSGGRRSAPGKCVLLVEDDELLRGAMKMVLEWEGYRVACAGDGREALDYLRRGERPALILLDVMLPALDGRQFREAQRRDPDLAAVPVVVVSALDAADCPDAAAHIRKPFAAEELLEAVRRQG
jgi:CheY-like chemotaxis protein